MRTLSTVTSLLAASLLAACGPALSRDGDDDPTPDAATSVDAPDHITNDDGGNPGGGCTKLDVLFVIDNSGSMGQEQSNLIANFPNFINVLDQSGLDYRVAVTTTSRDYHYTMFGGFPVSTGAGEDGTMMQPGACSMSKRWIDKADPNKATTFSCVANVGVNGNSDEMPLGSMRDAFEDRMADGTNMGFRRTDALLGVVFLTDEEDCSYEQSVSFGFTDTLCSSQMEPATNYVAFLDQYTGHRTRWAAAAIAGMGPGDCTSSFGTANEASRLKAFVQAAGTQARMSSICDGDLSVSLAQTLELFETACGGVIY